LNTSTGVISGTPTSIGTTSVTVTATNAGGNGSNTISITINLPAPVVTGGATTNTVNTAFSYSIVASNTPTSYSSTTLPAGLTLNTTTGVISGTPTVVGSTSVTVTATNVSGSGSGTITINVTNALPPAPVVTGGTTSGTVGSAFSYTVTANNSPTSYSSTILPAGLTLNTTTGVITGTPTAVGSTSVTITATNAGGNGSNTITITISAALPPAPVVTSGSHVGTVNTVFSYTIVASNTPTSYSSTALPAGLTLNTSTGVISGTPTAVGSTSVTVTAANAGGTGTGIVTITINPPPPVVTAGSSTGTINIAFNYSIVATNTPTSYSSTTLPSGLTLNTSTGVISGVPTAIGSTSVTITATNAGGNGSNTITITINPSAPVVSAGSSSGTVGTSFSYSVIATNSPISYSSTILPAGLTLNTTTGVISGTPTAVGSTSVTVTASNAGGNGSNTITITISAALPPAPVVSTGSPSGTVGTSFSYSVIATNSPTSYSSTTLPAGLTLNTTTGVISGTPTAIGSTSVTVTASNAGGNGSNTITITVSAALPPAPVVSGGSPSGTVGTSFSYSVIATNSPTSYSSTALPAGLTLNTTTGVISGTPTAVGSTSVTVTASNAGGNGSNTITITVSAALPPAPVVTAATKSGTVGTSFSYSVIATNSPTSYSSTTLPAGLTLNTTTGVISGTPTAVGSTSVTVTASNAGGNGSNTITITVSAALPPAPVVTAATKSGTVGTSFSYSVIATNSPTSYSSTTLPAGLTLNTTTGVISGTPTAVGSTSVTVTASNAGGNGSNTITITVSAALPPAPVVSAGSPSGTVGTSFSYSVIATNSPTSYSSTALPAGLTLNTTTGVISGTPTAVGTTSVTVTASNAGGNGSNTITITINPAVVIPVPLITSNGSVSGIIGTAFEYAITATNTPTSYSSTALPAGLILNTTTGKITGIPTAAGIFKIFISATNAGGTSSLNVVTITITIPLAPVITSDTVETIESGGSFTYDITADNSPTSYGALHLPQGLTIDPVLGKISGTPTVSGVFNITLEAINAVGTGTKTLVLTITDGNSKEPISTPWVTPNPIAPGQTMTVALPGWSEEQANVEIINFLGKVMQQMNGVVVGYSSVTRTTSVSINIVDLIAGDYIIIVRGEKDKAVTKFMVK